MNDDPIARALALEDPPARDPAFTLAVLRRAAAAERRRALARQAILIVAFAVSAIALAPLLEAWLAAPGPVLHTLLLALGAAAGALALSYGLRPRLTAV